MRASEAYDIMTVRRRLGGAGIGERRPDQESLAGLVRETDPMPIRIHVFHTSHDRRSVLMRMPSGRLSI